MNDDSCVVCTSTLYIVYTVLKCSWLVSMTKHWIVLLFFFALISTNGSYDDGRDVSIKARAPHVAGYFPHFSFFFFLFWFRFQFKLITPLSNVHQSKVIHMGENWREKKKLIQVSRAGNARSALAGRQWPTKQINLMQMKTSHISRNHNESHFAFGKRRKQLDDVLRRPVYSQYRMQRTTACWQANWVSLDSVFMAANSYRQLFSRWKHGNSQRPAAQ